MILSWEYLVCPCSFKATKKGGLFSREEGDYFIGFNGQDFELSPGLKQLGEWGYELVGIHKYYEMYGGSSSGGHHPSYYYIFKKPLFK